MAILRKAALFLLLFLAAVPAFAASPELVVEAPPSLESQARRLRELDPERLASAARLVGLDEPGLPIQVVLAPEGSEPARIVPSWVSGYALSERGIIVLLPQRVPTYPDSSLEDLMGHEVAHVLVARAAGNRPMPRWFHEGVAMIAGLTWGLDDRTRLTYSLVTDREISLAGLDDLFAGGEGAAHRAYAISGAFVRDLLDRHGEDAAARILDGVADGLPFEEAFRRATGVTLAAAESSFWSRQSFWYRWVPLLTSSVTLWLGITLLALYAIKRRRARDAALRRMWDEEEERLRLAREAAGERGETVH
jgi:peptidase MA superfamily protein